MVDLIYGRGITDLLREMPFYTSLFKKMVAYRLFGVKQPMYGSVDVNNVCNLHCSHCYWWLNRKEEKVHDSIRGEGAYAKTRKNILDYTAGPPRNGRPAWKEIWLSMTINSLNYMTVEDLIEEWRGKVNKIGLQFHTPFVKGDPLMLPFGEVRNQVVDKIIALKKRYPDFIVNPISQLALMKGNWGGVGTTPVDCPSWAILSLDHMGRVKQPCCIGSAESKSMKPICEECGLGCYSILVAQGIRGI